MRNRHATTAGAGILIAIVLGVFAAATARAATPPPSPKAAVVSLHGEVDDATRDGLFRQFKQARAAGATTVVVDLQTPGGLVTSALDITQFLRAQNDLHTIAYVRRAYSAGSMIAVACDEIVMAPGGVIGDCAPIAIGSDDRLIPLPPAERAKLQSPILSDFDASADRNHHDRLLLESMVVAERVVNYVQDPKTGKREFVDDKGYAEKLKAGWVDVPGVTNPVDGADTLLTLQADRAVWFGLAAGTADSPAAAAGKGVPVVADLSPGAGEAVVEFLNTTAVRGIFIAVLLTAIGITLGAPGHGAAEATIVVALGVLLGVPLLTGYAQWWEVVVILAGLALLAFEVFVFPGHGVSAISGILMVLGGLLTTFLGTDASGSLLPHSGAAWQNLGQGAAAVGGGMGGALVLAFLLRNRLAQLPYFRRLVLSTVSGGTDAHAAQVPPENAWPGVGTRGVAVTDLRPGGSAEFLDLAGGRKGLAVVSDSGYVVAGTPIIVREARGNRVVVRPAVVV